MRKKFEKEWLCDVEKKSEYPEKNAILSEALKQFLEKNDTFKGPSPAAIIGSGGGLVFSGSVFGTDSIVTGLVIVLCILYYFIYLIKLVFDYRIKRKDQDYEQSTGKDQENQHQQEMKQMEWDHEKELKQMELDHEKEMKQKERDHEYRMRKLDVNLEKGLAEDSGADSMLPPANVAELPPKYFS